MRSPVKNAVKKMMPKAIAEFIGSRVGRYRERRLGALPIGKAFDEVYAKKMWAQGAALSGPGSEGMLADRYVDFIREYMTANKINIVVDGGCGDFTIGARLLNFSPAYVGLDVSSRIIAVNKKKYANSDNIRFQCADLQFCTLPKSDVILVRQVLQHLTNAQIEKIIINIESQVNWRRVLITEQVTYPLNENTVNRDLPSHTVRTRVELGSGVFIDRPPFNRVANRVALIDDGQSGKPARNFLMIFELVR